MNEVKAIEGLNFLKGKLFNGIFKDKLECIDVAINALEKQTPMSPLSISGPDDNDNSLAQCPVCSANTDFCADITTSFHCWKCGQKLKLD